jgi:Toprim domain/Family of unknown function (DUF5906)
MKKIDVKINQSAQEKIEMITKKLRASKSALLKYANTRGIGSIPSQFSTHTRFSVNEPYWQDKKNIGEFKAIFIPFYNIKGEVINYLKIYLEKNYSKAKLSPAKKLMTSPFQGATSGCAMRIVDVSTNDKYLIVCEGPETGLALAHCIKGIPVWSASSATLLPNIKIPSSIERVCIFADKDKNKTGEKAANKLKKKLVSQGIKVDILLPEEDIGTDWLDVLIKKDALKTDREVSDDTQSPGQRFIAEIFNKAISSDDSIEPTVDTDSNGVESVPVEVVDIEKYKFSTKPNEIMTYFNSKHSIVPIGKDTKITYKTKVNGYDTVDYMSETSFNLLYKNWPISDTMLASTYWLRNIGRKEYKGIIFDPGKTSSSHYYNLFQGFGVKAIEGDCSKILWHIMEIICDGKTSLYEYVICWLAFMVQRPEVLPEVGLLLIGDHGVGKGAFGEILSKIVGKHFTKLTSAAQLTSRFSGHLAESILVFADEFDLDGKKPTVINSMMTELIIPLEKKGIDTIMVKNFRRFVFATNSQNPLALSENNRRFLTLHVSSSKQKDHGYFGALNHELNNSGAEAFFHYLLNTDISEFEVRKMPTDNTRFNSTIDMSEALLQWIYQGLNDGNWKTTIPKMDFFSEFKDWCTEQGLTPGYTSSTFGKRLHEIFQQKNISESRLTTGNNRKYYYIFASIEQCRKDFERLFNASPDIWTDLEEIHPSEERKARIKMSRL